MTEAAEVTTDQVTSEKAVTARRNIKERQGRVVSAKAQKTVIVEVERRVKHPRYHKYVAVRKRYAAHDTLDCVVGERVRIRESRPISKTKRWRVMEKLSKGS